MALTLTLKYGQIITIGDAKVCIDPYSNNQIRIKIEAPPEIKISRTQMAKKISLPEFNKLDPKAQEKIKENINKEMSARLKNNLTMKQAEFEVSQELLVSAILIKEYFKPTFKDRKWLTK